MIIFLERNSKIWLRPALDQADRPRKVQFSELQKFCDLDRDLGLGRGH